MEYIEFIKANWAPVFGVLAVMVFISFHIYRWLDKPRAEQISDLKEWLKFAVVEAEKALGSGTGELKLRSVYDRAISVFPWIKMFVPFEVFKGYVSEALDWMEEQLETNERIAEYVGR